MTLSLIGVDNGRSNWLNESGYLEMERYSCFKFVAMIPGACDEKCRDLREELSMVSEGKGE